MVHSLILLRIFQTVNFTNGHFDGKPGPTTYYRYGVVIFSLLEVDFTSQTIQKFALEPGNHVFLVVCNS